MAQHDVYGTRPGFTAAVNDTRLPRSNGAPSALAFRTTATYQRSHADPAGVGRGPTPSSECGTDADAATPAHHPGAQPAGQRSSQSQCRSHRRPHPRTHVEGIQHPEYR